MNEDHLSELKAARNISHVIDKRVSKIYTKSLTSMTHKTELLDNKAELKPQIIKNVLSTTFLMIKIKMRRSVE